MDGPPWATCSQCGNDVCAGGCSGNCFCCNNGQFCQPVGACIICG